MLWILDFCSFSDSWVNPIKISILWILETIEHCPNEDVNHYPLYKTHMNDNFVRFIVEYSGQSTIIVVQSLQLIDDWAPDVFWIRRPTRHRGFVNKVLHTGSDSCVVIEGIVRSATLVPDGNVDFVNAAKRKVRSSSGKCWWLWQEPVDYSKCSKMTFLYLQTRSQRWSPLTNCLVDDTVDHCFVVSCEPTASSFHKYSSRLGSSACCLAARDEEWWSLVSPAVSNRVVLLEHESVASNTLHHRQHLLFQHHTDHHSQCRVSVDKQW